MVLRVAVTAFACRIRACDVGRWRFTLLPPPVLTFQCYLCARSHPADQVKAGDVFKGKVVVLGVPGAFTPGCSKTHLPGYVAAADAIKAKGVSQIVCVSVNDAFVMKAWEEAQGATGKVRCLADPQAAFVKSLGLDVDLAVLGGVRSKRFSAIVEDGVIKALNVEPDNTGLTCSLADPIMKQL